MLQEFKRNYRELTKRRCFKVLCTFLRLVTFTNFLPLSVSLPEVIETDDQMKRSGAFSKMTDFWVWTLLEIFSNVDVRVRLAVSQRMLHTNLDTVLKLSAILSDESRSVVHEDKMSRLSGYKMTKIFRVVHTRDFHRLGRLTSSYAPS